MRQCFQPKTGNLLCVLPVHLHNNGGERKRIFLNTECKFLKTPPLSFPCEHPIWKYLKTVTSLLKLQHWITHLYGQNASTNSGGNRMRCCGRCTWSKLYVFSWHVWHWAECGIVFLVNNFFFLFFFYPIIWLIVIITGQLIDYQNNC